MKNLKNRVLFTCFVFAFPIWERIMKHIKISLWLRVENNNKFVRGKKRAREEIENIVLSR